MRISRKAKVELSWILLFLSCLPLLYMLAFGEAGYFQLRVRREQLQQIRLENLELRRRQLELQKMIQLVEHDPYALERIARERYSFARRGDIIVNLPAKPSGQ